MNDQSKTKIQLIDELEQTRTRVAELEQVEEALRESEEKYRTIFENVNDQLIYLNKYGTIISANDHEETYGRKPEEIIGKYFTKIGYFDVKDIPKYLKLFKDVIAGKKTFDVMELEIKHKDGHKIPVEVSTSLVKKNGRIEGFICIVRDISERKQAEAALRENEERYRSLVESTDDAVYLIGRDMRYEFANRKYLSRLGLSLADLIGQEYVKLHPWDTIEEFAKKVDQVIKSGKPMTYEYLSHRDNKYFMRTLSPVIDEELGEIKAITVTSKDITERKQAEEELRNRTYDLGERVKELNCLYCISKVIETPDATIDEIFQGTVDLIPPAWEYPEIACARIILDSQEFRTKNWQESEWRQTSDIEVGHERTGTVEVCYLEEKPESDEGPFLKEEQSLLNRVAEHLGSIIERKQVEENLRISEEKYRRLFETMQDGVLIADTISGEIIDVNPYLAELFKCNREAIIGKVVWEAHPFSSMLGMEEGFKSLRREGYSRFVTAYQSIPSGREIFVEFINNIYLIGGRGVIQCNVRDITEAKLAEKALRESEEKYRAIFEQAADSIVLVDAETGELIEFNDRTLENLGYTREEFEKLKIPDFEVIESVEEVAKHIEKIIKEGFDTFETKHRTKDGEIRDILVNSKAISIHGKDFVMSIWRDITERKRAEEALRESEEKYRQLFATVADAIVIYDTHTWQFIDVNQRAVELYGYTREEFLQMIQLDISAEPEASELSIKETLAGYRVHVSLQYHKKKDGTVFPVEISRGVYTFGERKVICGVIRDITETKLAEKALRESEEKYRSLVESSEDPIYLVDKDLQFLFANAKYLSRLGKSPDEVVGQGYAEFHSPEQVKEFAQKSEGVFKSCKPVVYEHKSLRDNRDFLRTLSPVIDPSTGRPTAITAISIDITERRRAQDELRESREQLRSLSAHLQTVREESQKLLAREIHDELGQDLTALKMDLSWMKGKLRQDQELLREKAAAMTKLADAMIKTVKKITARLRPALLDDLGVAAALEWELGEFAERTGIGCNLTVEPEEIDLDPDRSTAVYRIFQEALTNIARHSQATSVEAALRVDSGRLEMEISDNGAGITKVQIASPRSFGLIGIRERAMQFGGEVRIEGVKGKGTTISITLPLDDGGDHHD